MKQIIAMGGGGFSMEPDNPLLDKYVLQQFRSGKPKVCFIPTASGDSEGYIERYYKAFEQHDCIPSHLSLFRPPTHDFEDYILDKDIVYVGGGNTKNLLAIWRDWGLDKVLKKAWENEVILTGVSAGSICWFEEGVTDSIPGELTSLPCLGLLTGSNCPHYDGEADRRPSYHRLLRKHKIGSGVAADDGAAIHFHDDEIYRVVSSRPRAKAFRVSCVDNVVQETQLETVYLGE